MNKRESTGDYFVKVMALLLGFIPIVVMILWGGIRGFGLGIAEMCVSQWGNWKELWND